MKALILAGGTGTRLRPFTYTITKQLLPIANRPVLSYILDKVRDLEIKEAAIIISPEKGGAVKNIIRDGSAWNTHFTYILQSAPLGLAHAVKTAERFLGDSPFLMILGDSVFNIDLRDLKTLFQRDALDALIFLKEVDNPSASGIAELNSNGEVIHVEEKPIKPRSNLAVLGLYFFSATIHEAISSIKPSYRGELEITDAIQKLIEMGKIVRAHPIKETWIDISSKEDLLEANRFALDNFLKPNNRGQVDAKSHIVGKVEIGEQTIIKNSFIHGPVSIADHCLIKDTFIGQFSSIGAKTVIENSSVEYSIVMEGCHIYGMQRLERSIIGKETVLTKKQANTNALMLLLGNNCNVLV